MALQPKKNRRERKEKTEAIQMASMEPTKRLNAEIPQSLHSQVKIQAVRENRKIVELVIDALREYLSKNSIE